WGSPDAAAATSAASGSSAARGAACSSVATVDSLRSPQGYVRAGGPRFTVHASLFEHEVDRDVDRGGAGGPAAGEAQPVPARPQPQERGAAVSAWQRGRLRGGRAPRMWGWDSVVPASSQSMPSGESCAGACSWSDGGAPVGGAPST